MSKIYIPTYAGLFKVSISLILCIATRLGDPKTRNDGTAENHPKS